MRVCFVARSYPLDSAAGWVHCRQSLAGALSVLGHEVMVITQGHEPRVSQVAPNLWVHELALPPGGFAFSEQHPQLNELLTFSQAVCERVIQLQRRTPVDIVDAPLAMVAGLAIADQKVAPLVVWLNEEQLPEPLAPAAEAVRRRLERECLQLASGVVGDTAALRQAELDYGWQPGEQPCLELDGLKGSTQLLASRMAAFYSAVCGAHRSALRMLRANRVLQVMEALDYGDAVSNITRCNARLLAEMGQPATVLSLFADPRVAAETTSLREFEWRGDEGVICHYWNYSHLEGFFRFFRGPKAIHFHNLTPPRYFTPGSRAFQSTQWGYDQLARIADWFDLIIGDSEFNLVEYARFLSQPRPTLCIPPVIEAEAITSAPWDEALYWRLFVPDEVRFLFVGRVTRNKRQDQLMHMFDYYYRSINRHSRLFLVGSTEHDPEYMQELVALRARLVSGERIVFTGKVSDEAVRTYYRLASVFVSASEHEGFGVPLLEAMVYGVPVVAQAAAAVPETMGQSGVLVHRWQPDLVAELINLLLKDDNWRARLLFGQLRNLERFSRAQVRERLAAAVDYLCQGTDNSLFVWRGGECKPDEAAVPAYDHEAS